MRKVLITGASGLVGTELIYNILTKGNDRLFLISTHVNLLKEKYKDVSRIECHSIEEVERMDDRYDCIIHLAFARSKDAEQLAKALDFTERILTLAKKNNIDTYINISSQSIYGDIHNPLWKETECAAPNYLYALGKYSTEKMTGLAFQGTKTNWTNIRLASVCEKARFVNTFVKNVISGNPINIIGGKQMCSFIDVRDVADALYRIIERSGDIKFREVYNLGTGIQTSIVEIADSVNRIGNKEYSLPQVNVNIEPKDIYLNVGMDNSLFRKEFDWSPCFNMDDMIRSMFELNMHNAGETVRKHLTVYQVAGGSYAGVSSTD